MPEAPFQKVWQVGEAVTAADLNANIRDGYNFALKTKPAARAYNTVGQTITNATWTNLIFSTEVFDITDNTRSNVDRMDIVVPGLYLCTANVSFQGDSANGGRALRFTVNGTAFNGIAACAAAPAGQNTALGLTRLIYLAKGDILRMQGYQDSGGNVGIQLSFGEINALQVAYITSATAIR